MTNPLKDLDWTNLPGRHHLIHPKLPHALNAHNLIINLKFLRPRAIISLTIMIALGHIISIYDGFYYLNGMPDHLWNKENAFF